MKSSAKIRIAAALLLAISTLPACGSSQKAAAQEPSQATNATASAMSSKTGSSNAATSPGTSDPLANSNASSLDALPPPSDDANAKSRHSLSMTESRGTVDTATSTIPLPTKIDVPSQAGVDTAIKAVPSAVPVGKLDKSALEAPLRDPSRFGHCRIPYGTHVEIAAVVYNGSTLGVDVQTKPADKALAFCIERTVRQTTFVKELAVNKVKVSF